MVELESEDNNSFIRKVTGKNRTTRLPIMQFLYALPSCAPQMCFQQLDLLLGILITILPVPVFSSSSRKPYQVSFLPSVITRLLYLVLLHFFNIDP